MTKDEALKAAIKAMENSNSLSYEMMHAIADCKEALAQPEQKPVEDVVAYHSDGTRTVRIAPKRPWVGLTDEEFDEIWRMDLNNKDIMDKTIAKLRELNT